MGKRPCGAREPDGRRECGWRLNGGAADTSSNLNTRRFADNDPQCFYDIIIDYC